MSRDNREYEARLEALRGRDQALRELRREEARRSVGGRLGLATGSTIGLAVRSFAFTYPLYALIAAFAASVTLWPDTGTEAVLWTGLAVLGAIGYVFGGPPRARG